MTDASIQRPVTIRDVAQAAGVNHSTVSRALSNSTQVSEATKTRIRTLAETMGYRPDPFVSAFTAKVRGYRGSPDHATIAVFNGWKRDRDCLFLNRYVNGVRRRAEELGHRLDFHTMRELKNSYSALNRILRTRNTPGFLILPVPQDLQLAEVDFGHLASACIDYSLKSPRLHCAAPAYFQHMQLALETLSSRGYQRIGYCTQTSDIQRIGAHWLGAYSAWQQLHMLPTSPIPVHVVVPSRNPETSRDPVPEEWVLQRQRFQVWLEKAQPDVVISNNFYIYDWMQELGLSVPRDLGFATLCTDPMVPQVAGIEQQHEAIGAAAVDLVLGQFHRNDYGIPSLPKTVSVNGIWSEAESVRPA